MPLSGALARIAPLRWGLLGVDVGRLEELLANGHRLSDGLLCFPALLVFAKKLFAHEKHSYAEAVALDVLVMPVARADLLAILHGIAAKRHSGTIAVPVLALVFSQSFLDQSHHIRFRKELVGPAVHVLLREPHRALEGVLLSQVLGHRSPWFWRNVPFTLAG